MAYDSSFIVAALRRHPIWRDADDTALRLLVQGARVEDSRPGQMLVREGQPADRIHLLVDGAARTFYVATRARPELTVKLLRSPSAFGDVACVLRGPYSASIEALTQVRTLAIDAPTYFSALLRSPAPCFRQYFDLAERFGGATQIEKSTYAASLHERIVALLAAYARELGIPVEGGIQIDAALTQDDIASQTGSNRRTVVRSLGLLYESGALKRHGRKYVVTSVDALLLATPGEVPDMVHSTRQTTWLEELLSARAEGR
ncbi:MAG: Crp/Fnr family transcriptional regulator [Deltaproteobacteria bacterium]|nr:Crp/Fnr family transcriptional regulator [Deltaproteobacteria bacterium]